MTAACSIDDCAKPAKGRTGWCVMHFTRWRRHGDPLVILRPGPPRSVGGSVEQRFWAKVDKNHPDGCWEWTAQRLPFGYGRFWVGERLGLKTKIMVAHRWSYEHLVGPVPDGLQLDHLCRNPPCVNPEHLEPVTCRENLLRGETFQAANAAKTHCPQGHLYDEANTESLERKPGYVERRCRVCHRLSHNRSAERARERWMTKGIPAGKPRSHCRRGHELTAANLRIGSDGKRKCRSCERQNKRQERARARGLISATP